jgi:hypothetical protein
MTGSLVGECNCDWGCPCNFDAPPTYGHCEGMYALSVGEGRYGDVPLDGCTFLMGGHSPGPIHEGDLTGILVIDDRTTRDQRSAIETIWRGGGVGMPFDAFASVTTTWLEPRTARIEIELDGIRSSVRVDGGQLYQAALTRIPNPVTGEEEEIYLDKPTGFTSTRSELGTTRVAILSADDLSYENTGRYAEYAEFTYSGP